MAESYGLPYKGSKNKLASKIYNLFPKRKNLVDLFCGGGAITHYTLLRNDFEHVIMNDINPHCTQLFIDAAKGKYKNETRWISREDFFNLKNNDPYVSLVWSFGNNLKQYLYGSELEPIKKAWHNAIFFDDYEAINDFLQTDVSELREIKNRYLKYLESKKYIHNTRPELQNIEQLKRLQSLERLERLEIMNNSFEQCQVPSDSIIYCDIPYENTDGYITDFPFNDFYAWALSQKELCFISSYQMPEDKFECIATFEHRSTLAANSNKLVFEKVFIPKHQVKLYKENQVQPSLFDNLY